MKSITYLILAGFITFLNCGPAKTSTNSDAKEVLSARELQPYGRTFISKDDRLGLISSAVHFGFTFEGKECKVSASLESWQDHNYLQYELDGVYQKRIRISKGNNQPFTITADKEGKHTVWIYKATEAHSGTIYIGEVRGKNLVAIKPA